VHFGLGTGNGPPENLPEGLFLELSFSARPFRSESFRSVPPEHPDRVHEESRIAASFGWVLKRKSFLFNVVKVGIAFAIP
jgi:hypothetical protein